ncbi:RAMP superfamily CRISPR-associated protein [Vibrio sp. WXL210]|uniref:RAMP superfamily CRISPR-associated protein n=1 Tax=Vibrio sp. WXL210 TaxID=3450709 RepID=UPI003EC78EF3
MGKTQLTLSLDIVSEWHIGSGEEGGAKADSLVLKDALGLPYVPGRSLKGLIREAVNTAMDNQWFSSDLLSVLGQEGTQIDSQSSLHVSSACLSTEDVSYFRDNQHSAAHLYRVITSTAIEGKTGVAKPTSLRSMEVAVPMRLTAKLELVDKAQLLVEEFKAVLPLITRLGAKRQRGLGQVYVSVESVRESV